MALIGNGAPFFYVGTALIIVGLILHIVGLATPSWFVDDYIQITVGLWKICSDTSCLDISEDVKNATIRTCEAFSILAIFPACAALVCCIIHIVTTTTTEVARRLYITIAVWLSFSSAVCILICLLVWRFGDWRFGVLKKLDLPLDDLGYSFYLSVIGVLSLSLSMTFLRLYLRRLGQGSYQVMP